MIFYVLAKEISKKEVEKTRLKTALEKSYNEMKNLQSRMSKVSHQCQHIVFGLRLQ